MRELEEAVATSRDRVEKMEAIMKQIYSELDLSSTCTDGSSGGGAIQPPPPLWHVGVARGITPPTINKGETIADSAELYERNRNLLSHMTKSEVKGPPAVVT